MTNGSPSPEKTLPLHVKFIPHCLVRGLLQASLFIMGGYSSILYLLEFLSYLRDGYVNPDLRNEFFAVVNGTQLTGWVGLDRLLLEGWAFIFTPSFFLSFSLIGWMLYAAFEEDFASRKYKELEIWQRIKLDEYIEIYRAVCFVLVTGWLMSRYPW